MSEDGQLSSNERHIVHFAMYAAGTVSFCASLFACACYVALRHKRTFGLQLVFFLSLNDTARQLWVVFQAFRGQVRARAPQWPWH